MVSAQDGLPALRDGPFPSLEDAAVHPDLALARQGATLSVGGLVRCVESGMRPGDIARVHSVEDGRWAALAGERAGLWFASSSTWLGPLGPEAPQEAPPLPENPAEDPDFLMESLRAGSTLSPGEALKRALDGRPAFSLLGELSEGDVQYVMLVRERRRERRLLSAEGTAPA